MARTSVTSPLRIDEVACSNGLIGMTMHPGKKGESIYGEPWDRDLKTDLDVIEVWGASDVVTLVEGFEFDLLETPDFAIEACRRSFNWYHLPFVDGGIPDARFEEAWPLIGAHLKHHLREGKRILIHCRGGLGRTGLVAARLLIEFGSSTKDAMRTVREARPGAIQTLDQERFLLDLRP